MRAALVLVILLAAGCVGDAPAAAEGWTFARAQGDAISALESSASFAHNRSLTVAAGESVLGDFHGRLNGSQPFTLWFESSVPMRVSLRFIDGPTQAAGSARCTWAENETRSKAIGVGTILMQSTATTCRVAFTPDRTLRNDDGPVLLWEAVARGATEGWTLRFAASS